MGMFAFWPVLTLILVATVMDLRSRRIPNWLTLPFFAAGLVTSGVVGGLPGLLRSAQGVGVAVLFLLAFCLLRGMGWGDLKLCAAVGAWMGPGQMLCALVATGIAGGLAALAAIMWQGVRYKLSARLTLDDPEAFKLPYAPAIAIGTLFSFLAL